MPPYLRVRIIDSVRDTPRHGEAMPVAGMMWRPLLGLAVAACFIGMVTFVGAIFVDDEVEPAAIVEGQESAANVDVAAASPGDAPIERPAAVEQIASTQPAAETAETPPSLLSGRLVVARVEAPLRQEVEFLRRDTQRATEIVLGSLPFGGGVR